MAREKHSVAAELEGALLVSRSSFPYFMLVAIEAGGPIRALLLLLISPLLSLFEKLRIFEESSLKIMIFVSTFGIKMADLKAVAKATLVKFYLEGLRESAYKVLTSYGGTKYVISGMPRTMVEPFLREYLNVDGVAATELRTFRGRSLGVALPERLIAGGVRKFEALKMAVGGDGEVDLGVGDGLGDHPFMFLCREIHLIPPNEKASPLQLKDYPKALIFHDGRLVALPTPLDILSVFLWLPPGIILAVCRILIGFLPYQLHFMGCAAIGLRIRAQLNSAQAHNNCGTLYVSCHRTLLDPVFISTVLQRKVSALTYSLSSFSELISPIPTFRLDRDREKDQAKMRAALDRGDLVVCPEGTTCREPYLLRFSPLFAEITESIVPVAASVEVGMFYGTTVRGYKWLDSFFFLMNPSPCYRLEFLDRLQLDEPKSSYDVANQVQKSIGLALGFECTNLTRKDKYRMLVGNDGVVSSR